MNLPLLSLATYEEVMAGMITMKPIDRRLARHYLDTPIPDMKVIVGRLKKSVL